MTSAAPEAFRPRLHRALVRAASTVGATVLAASVLLACSSGSDGAASGDDGHRLTAATSPATVGPGSSPAPPAPTEPTTSAPTTTTTEPATTTTEPATTTTTTPPPPPALSGADLRPGDQSADVAALQQRLSDLRFWVGPLDGQYGHLVQQAVYAFEKANGLPVDGTVSGGDHGVLATATPFPPQSGPGTGRLIEVDKTRQLLILVVDGRTDWVFNAASGTEQPYVHPEDGPQVADTPPGLHAILFGIDEVEDGKMGRLYRPRYFHPDAIAVHGDPEVPPAPVSHGCVRVSVAAMDLIWAEDRAPVGTPVWVYGESPPPWPGG